jgi:hypothetical protein
MSRVLAGNAWERLFLAIKISQVSWKKRDLINRFALACIRACTFIRFAIGGSCTPTLTAILKHSRQFIFCPIVKIDVGM